MPIEKSDNTAKVPLLHYMTQRARAEYRPIADEKYRQAHAGAIARMNYTLKQQEQARKEAERRARQGIISQGRGRSTYDQTVQRQNEQRAKQILEAERQAQAEAEAQALLRTTLPTEAVGTVMRGMRNVINGNEHSIADALATHGNTQGLFELSEATENWAKEHPYISGGVNLVGDFVLPTTLTMGTRAAIQAFKPLATRLAETMPQVSFQQGGLRIGNSVYRAPRLQLNAGVPLPERVPVAPTPEELAARKFYPVEQYGDAPIYSTETMPERIKLRRDWSYDADPYADVPDLDIVQMNYNFNHDTPMSPRQVFDDMNNRFAKSAHGRAVGFDENYALSTDSYPLALNFFKRQQQNGLGRFFTPEQIERTPYVYLNEAGKRPITQETVDFLNGKIARFNSETGMNVQSATLGILRGKPVIQVQPIGFFKFKNGGLINCIPDNLLF